MRTCLVTGAGGLIGSEASRYFSRQGFKVVGIENDMRKYFFGDEASTKPEIERLLAELAPDQFVPQYGDIRDVPFLSALFARWNFDLIIHTAAQPSHDWAASEPLTDFSINAVGTLNLLDATRKHCPEATFVHCSTSKVYGDTPNRLPLERSFWRFDLPPEHEFYNGITPAMSIDQSLHSLFGVSKASGDLLVQEYGRYFDMRTVCFRPGCLTGPAHAGTRLHGFLSYLMRCAITGKRYFIEGYGGHQVRCNIHSGDLVRAFHAFHESPKCGAVYNIGGGRQNSISMKEAIDACERISNRSIDHDLHPTPRIGDHKWWISDNAPFQTDYPAWEGITVTLEQTLQEIHDYNVERWSDERQHQTH